jgi:hypothetical protein
VANEFETHRVDSVCDSLSLKRINVVFSSVAAFHIKKATVRLFVSPSWLSQRLIILEFILVIQTGLSHGLATLSKQWWKNLVLRVYHKIVFLIWSKGKNLICPWWENSSLSHTKCHPRVNIVISWASHRFPLQKIIVFKAYVTSFRRIFGI